MNMEILWALLENPSVIIMTFFAEPLAGVCIAYGLVWLAMRPKDRSSISIPFYWHLLGIITTIIGSAIVRIVAMITFAGRSAYDPSAEGGGAGFYMLILPAIVACGVIAFTKKKLIQNNKKAP